MSELSWHAGLTGSEIDEVTALATAAMDADGVAPLGEHVLLHLSDDSTVHLLARDGHGHGHVVGFAHLDPADADDTETGSVAELTVHPRHRRGGLGTRIVEALLERTGGHLRVWAHGQLPGAVAIAERLGFSAARTLWQMSRSLLTPLATPTFPDGVRVRPFVVGADEAEFLRVNNAAFDWHPEQGGWDVEQVKVREAEPWFDPAGFLLAVDESDRLLGYHWTKVHGPGEHGPEPIGEVYVLGVDPAAWGKRLGEALTLAGLHHLRDRGLTQVMLYVEADNAAAVRVYERLGFVLSNTDVSYAR
jgi:mycothiol synthase